MFSKIATKLDRERVGPSRPLNANSCPVTPEKKPDGWPCALAPRTSGVSAGHAEAVAVRRRVHAQKSAVVLAHIILILCVDVYRVQYSTVERDFDVSIFDFLNETWPCHRRRRDSTGVAL